MRVGGRNLFSFCEKKNANKNVKKSAKSEKLKKNSRKERISIIPGTGRGPLATLFLLCYEYIYIYIKYNRIESNRYKKFNTTNFLMIYIGRFSKTPSKLFGGQI